MLWDTSKHNFKRSKNFIWTSINSDEQIKCIDYNEE
jgi:hypothetical protein